MAPLLDMQLLRVWEERLELGPTETYRVRRSQVTCTYEVPYRLVGYCHSDNTLYYDRGVDEATIIHELLHKKYPDWTDSQVRHETKRLVGLIGGLTGST